MGKDPACLFYWGDWAGGTSTLSRHLKGCYMDLLHAQFNNGPLSLDEVKTVLGSDFGSAWPALQKKFAHSENGFFNERLQKEKDKRVKYSKSRKKNLEESSLHMENENRNEIKNDNEDQGVRGDFEDWKIWGDSIVNQEDQYWEQMKGRVITRQEMNDFLSVATRNDWVMKTQQAFRTTLNGFKVTGFLTTKEKPKAFKL